VLWLCSIVLIAWQSTGIIQGNIRTHSSREPVAHATVQIPALGRQTVADERGYYVLTGLRSGRWAVRVSALGHRTAERVVEIPASGSLRLDVDLEPAALALDSLAVVADTRRPVELTGPSATRLDAATIKGIPALAEADVFRAVQTLPSVAAASDFSSALYVRGGSPDQNLITLDGAPLFNPYHLGGIFAAIDPDAIASVNVRPGALPASAGDRLSSTVEIWTRDGGRDRLRSSGALGLISSRGSLDGPLPGGKGTFLVSARRTYLDLFTGAAHRLGLIPESLPYSFTDAHVKLTHDVGSSGRLSGSLYLNDERFRLPDTWTIGDRTDWQWGSRAASLNYRQPLGGVWLLEAQLARSSFDGLLEAFQRGAGAGGGDTRFADGRTTMRADLAGLHLTRYGRSWETRVGAQVDRYLLEHDFVTEGSGTLATFIPTLERTDRPGTAAAYVESHWTPNTRFGARAGLRALHRAGGETTWMPRAAVRWSATDHLALTLGGGRTAQVIHTLRDEEAVAASLFAYDLLVAPPAGTPPAIADDVVLGTEWGFGLTTLRVDGYLKRMRNLALAPLAPDPNQAAALVGGDFGLAEGTSRGLEVLARHEQGRSSGWLAYAFSTGERTLDGERFPPRFQRRHTLDLVGSTALGERGQASFRTVFGSGQAYTPVVGAYSGSRYDPLTGLYTGGNLLALYGEHNSATLPGYFRLDLALRKSWDRTYFGRPGTLTGSFQVLNALATRNVLAARSDPRGQTVTLSYGPQLPFLPTFGIEWAF
jgi:hypothetical protein